MICSLITGSLVLLVGDLLLSQRPQTILLAASTILLASAFFLMVFHYFTAGKAAEDERLLLEQRLSFLVRHVKDYAIFLIDPEGRVMSWNEGAQQIKGYTEEEIIGQPISLFYTDEDNRNGEPFQNLRRALEEGRYESIGIRKRKDGSVFFADVIFTPIYDDKHNLKGFAKITRDITDQKKAEEDMLNTLRREKELNEMKSRFVTLASHEFKTPLSVILSSVSLIEKYEGADMQDKRIKHIQRIKSNVNNLKQILNDFLSLEMLEGGIVKNSPEPTDLVHLLQETIQDMESSVKEGQRIEQDLSGTPRAIPVDPQLLRNILNNLLSNAIKYSPEQALIHCSITFKTHSAEIAFRDQGIGIPPDEQASLFERFFRATNTTGISGTGLGLSIVKKYLDLMGAQISLVSHPGQGSVFTVTLPA